MLLVISASAWSHINIIVMIVIMQVLLTNKVLFLKSMKYRWINLCPTLLLQIHSDSYQLFWAKGWSPQPPTAVSEIYCDTEKSLVTWDSFCLFNVFLNFTCIDRYANRPSRPEDLAAIEELKGVIGECEEKIKQLVVRCQLSLGSCFLILSP